MLPIDALFEKYRTRYHTRDGKPAFDLKISHHKYPPEIVDHWFKVSAEDEEGFTLSFWWREAYEEAFRAFVNTHYKYSHRIPIVQDGSFGRWLVLNDPDILICNDVYVWDREEYILEYVRTLKKHVWPKLKAYKLYGLSMRYQGKTRQAFQDFINNKPLTYPIPCYGNGKPWHTHSWAYYIEDIVGTFGWFWDELCTFRDQYNTLVEWEHCCKVFVEQYRYMIEDDMLQEKTEHADDNTDLS